MTHPRSLLACPLLVSLLLGTSPAVAHSDDPKVYDRQPPYEGIGYRRGLSAHGVEFDSEGIILHAWLTLDELSPGVSGGNDCWGYVSPSGREYAIMGLRDGTVFVEISNPDNPLVIQHVNGPNRIWRDIKVYRDHAYAVSEGGQGIQVLDLSEIDEGTITLVRTIDDVGTSATHNVAINEDSGFLYRLGGDTNGMRIYSLADPANPVHVASWLERYIHDAVIVTFDSGPNVGREIAFCNSGFNDGSIDTGLDILDLTNKQDIRVLSRYVYPQGQYSHQGWLSPDRQLLYVNDELDEVNNGVPTRTRIIDVSDLGNPQVVSEFSTGLAAIDHNLYVRGNLCFQANYRSGLRVFDVRDPQNPREVAFFDTYPANDRNRFNGLWSNYPYFPSGTIIGSDIERGLFVWSLGTAADIPNEPIPGAGAGGLGGLGGTGRYDPRAAVGKGPGTPGLEFPVPPRRLDQDAPIAVNEVSWDEGWVEIINRSAQRVELDGWTLGSADGVAFSVALSGRLEAGSLKVIEGLNAQLPDAADGLVIRDAAGTVSDELRLAPGMRAASRLSVRESGAAAWQDLSGRADEVSPGRLNQNALAPCPVTSGGESFRLRAADPGVRSRAVTSLVDLVNESEHRVDLALSVLPEDGALLQALSLAKVSGVTLRVVLAGEAVRSEQATAWTRALGESCVVADDVPGFTHAFAVADEHHGWMAESSRWSGDLASGLVLDARPVAEAFARELDELHALGRFGADKKNDTSHAECFEDDTRLELYFTPSDDAFASGLVPALHRSTDAISMVGERVGDERVVEALVAAAVAGRQVRVLVEDATGLGELVTAGAEIRVVADAPEQHVVIDSEVLVTGTTGWSGDAEVDAHLLLAWDEFLASRRLESFDGAWADAKPTRPSPRRERVGLRRQR
ncbi:MAG: choice-of-anchor B family protein [Acidobacteriota bacterium]